MTRQERYQEWLDSENRRKFAEHERRQADALESDRKFRREMQQRSDDKMMDRYNEITSRTHYSWNN